MPFEERKTGRRLFQVFVILLYAAISRGVGASTNNQNNVASEVLVAHQQNQQLLPATVTRAYSSSRPEMIKPILEPIAKMIDSFDPQASYQRRHYSDAGGTERVLRALRLLPEPTTTTTPTPTPIERIFNPLFDSIRQGLRKMADAPQNQNQQQFQHQQKPDFAFSKDHPVFPFASMASAATSATDIDDNNGVGAAADEERRGAIPATMMNIEGVRRAPPAVPNLLPSGSGMSSSSSGAAAVSSMISPSEQYQQQQQQQMMDFKKFTGPLKSLLETFGVNAAPRDDEIHVGRDETISVLGMPIGRRDGLALSPKNGLSYGPSYSIGPFAINDRYNVKWDFLDKINSVFFS